MAAFLRILFVIPIALMVALGVAVFVYLAAFGFTRADIWGGPDNALPVIIYPVAILLADIARFAFLPFLAGIVLSEILAIRSMLAWTLFGGAVGIGIHLAAYGAAAPMLPPARSGILRGLRLLVDRRTRRRQQTGCRSKSSIMTRRPPSWIAASWIAGLFNADGAIARYVVGAAVWLARRWIIAVPLYSPALNLPRLTTRPFRVGAGRRALQAILFRSASEFLLCGAISHAQG